MIYKINEKIEIIVLIEKEDYRIRKSLEKIGVLKIFIESSFNVKKLANKNDKDMMFVQSQPINKEKNLYKKKIHIDKAIAIAGNYGSGKSVITAMLGKAAKNMNIKTIIIDFDILNNSINTLFRVPKCVEASTKVSDYINTIANNLDVFCGIDMMFTEDNKISYEKVRDLIDELKNIYDLILIDTSSETTLKYIKVVIANCDKILFLIEPNLLEMKKAQRLLEVYIEDWEVPIDKISILLNKTNHNSIDKEIVKGIFNKFKIVGNIHFSNFYTSIANSIKVGPLTLKKYIAIIYQL